MNFLLNYISKVSLPPDFDEYQFAYTKNRSVEDAISINVHEILNHLETSQSYARVLFIDYSSAFNTIIPQKLFDKLIVLKFPIDTCNWILDFLLNRPQAVKIKDNMSPSLVLNTGAPKDVLCRPNYIKSSLITVKPPTVILF